MTKRSLSEEEIEKTYEMISSYHSRYLKKFGVKMPRPNTKDALILIYLAQGYPKTRRVSKRELTEFIRNFNAGVADVQQPRHLAQQKGWYIASGTRGNRGVTLERGEYQLCF